MNICLDDNSRYLVFTRVKLRSIITVMGCLPIKGGCCDNNGAIFNSRGGGKRTEHDSLLCQGTLAQRRDAGTQDRHEMAHRSCGIRGVEKTEAEPIQAVSGKLNSSSVAHLRPKVAWNPLSSRRRCSRYLTVYYSVLWQQISTVRRHYNWQGVAVWRESL